MSPSYRRSILLFLLLPTACSGTDSVLLGGSAPAGGTAALPATPGAGAPGSTGRVLVVGSGPAWLGSALESVDGGGVLEPVGAADVAAVDGGADASAGPGTGEAAAPAVPTASRDDAGTPPAGDAGVPSISSIEPLTLAADGVAIVTTDQVPRDELLGVSLAGATISIDDAEHFLWLGTTGNTQRFAVRLPSGVALGASELQLELRGSESPRRAFAVVPAAPFGPPTPRGIMISPGVSQIGDTFPVGTQTAFPLLLDDTDTLEGHWYYNLSFARECANGDPDLLGSTRGSFAGLEVYYPLAPFSVGVASCNPDSGSGLVSNEDGQIIGSIPGSFCSPMDGNYQLDSSTNQATITIYRSAALGGPEEFRGAWGILGREGVTATESTVAGDLVLTSQRTGRQLIIKHATVVGCDNFSL